MDVQMRDEPGTDETPREDEEVREAHHDAVAVPFTPTPTRPGMNPRATPWTPSTPRVRFPAFSSVGAPHEHGTPHPGTPQTPHPGSPLTRGSPLVTPYAPYGVSRFPPSRGDAASPGAARPAPPFSARRSHEHRRDAASPRLGGALGRRAHAPPSLPDDTRGGGAARPRNDYSAHFVATGERPQNFILDGASSASARLERFPTRRELAALKRAHVARHAQPAMWLKCDLAEFALEPASFGNVLFDAILLDPPWRDPRWPPARVAALRVDQIADPRGAFVFLWCGDGNDHLLERGRECLRAWGFRRVEEIVWLKTNKEKRNEPEALGTRGASSPPPSRPVLLPTKEHCLVGILGNLRRDRDGHIMHANIDVDVIVSEAPPPDASDDAKPLETYDVVENFCQGRRRLELFGTDANRRAGWVTLGESLSDSNFDPAVLASHFAGPAGSAAGPTLPRHQRIEALRPKTPPFSRSGTLHP